MSRKHLTRYVHEFVGRHNMRELNTLDQMMTMVVGMKWKTLPYKLLISVCGKTPFYDGVKPRDGIRRSGDHVDLGDVRPMAFGLRKIDLRL